MNKNFITNVEKRFFNFHWRTKTKIQSIYIIDI